MSWTRRSIDPILEKNSVPPSLARGKKRLLRRSAIGIGSTLLAAALCLVFTAPSAASKFISDIPDLKGSWVLTAQAVRPGNEPSAADLADVNLKVVLDFQEKHMLCGRMAFEEKTVPISCVMDYDYRTLYFTGSGIWGQGRVVAKHRLEVIFLITMEEMPVALRGRMAREVVKAEPPAPPAS